MKCTVLNEEIKYHLRGESRTECQELLFEVVSTALLKLDQHVPAQAAEERGSDQTGGRPATGTADADAEYLSGRLTIAREQVELAAKRTLQLRYIFGMFATSLVLGVVVALLVHGRPEKYPALVSVGAGAAGAVVSTFVRMSDRRGLRLDRQLSPGNAALLGFVRTVLGATFGIVLYLLLTSGLVVLAPLNTSHKVEFYAALAFIAGFSERFAPDALGVVGVLGHVQQGNEEGGDAIGQ